MAVPLRRAYRIHEQVLEWRLNPGLSINSTPRVLPPRTALTNRIVLAFIEDTNCFRPGRCLYYTSSAPNVVQINFAIKLQVEFVLEAVDTYRSAFAVVLMDNVCLLETSLPWGRGDYSIWYHCLPESS